MILETCRGRELYHLVYKDFKTALQRQIKKERDKARQPFLKKRTVIQSPLWVKFYYQAPSYNRWFVQTALLGDPALPKSHVKCHCITQAGPGSSKMYVIFRGWITAKKQTGGVAGGYIVSVLRHTLLRMKERGPRDWAWLSEDELVGKIFTMEENGIYYDFDWTKYSEKKSNAMPVLPEQEDTRPEWIKEREKKNKVEESPIVLRTTAGLFLGYSTSDRSEVRLITYLGDGSSLTDEEERDELINFLGHTWVVFNKEVFSEEEVSKSRESLNQYMNDKTDRNVYILAI